eukprot:COSAG02_NODE_29040_length_577_cov_0.755230_1_plen_30_part_10
MHVFMDAWMHAPKGAGRRPRGGREGGREGG